MKFLKAFEVRKLFIFFAMFIIGGCEILSQEDLVGELEIPDHDIVIQGKLGNAISDPLYIRAYANGKNFIRCKMADRVEFAYEMNTLTVISNCNLEYEYDRIQKEHIKSLKIIYKHFE